MRSATSGIRSDTISMPRAASSTAFGRIRTRGRKRSRTRRPNRSGAENGAGWRARCRSASSSRRSASATPRRTKLPRSSGSSRRRRRDSRARRAEAGAAGRAKAHEARDAAEALRRRRAACGRHDARSVDAELRDRSSISRRTPRMRSGSSRSSIAFARSSWHCATLRRAPNPRSSSSTPIDAPAARAVTPRRSPAEPTVTTPVTDATEQFRGPARASKRVHAQRRDRDSDRRHARNARRPFTDRRAVADGVGDEAQPPHHSHAADGATTRSSAKPK